ncbi:MAG: OPT/YSL family transporter, partial [Faecalibacterium sp.]|nr:OPT/YSL family transporter [Faecalibacterium sp.]
IIKSWGIIVDSVKRLGKTGSADQTAADTAILRTQKDLPFRFILWAAAITLVIVFLFFWFGVMDGNLLFALVAIVLTAVVAFLFTTVAANAIAIVGSNPVSGMTLMTLILASVVMVAVGLKGTSGMVAALVMGGVVCTALSMAVYLITDTKTGKLYVGSATSQTGMLLQRWSSYIADGHGGNEALKELVKKQGFDYVKENFQYSILENYNARMDDEYILRRESWWKETLRTREFGYNKN